MSGSHTFLEDFVSGDESFCKRIQYSRRLQQVWTTTFTTDCDGYHDFITFGYAEQRFSSRKGPAQKVVLKTWKVLKFAKILADDNDPSHRADKLWGITFCERWLSRKGFVGLVKFASDCDYATATHSFMCLPADKCKRDASLNPSDALNTLDIVDSMFLESRAFELTQDNFSFTAEMIKNLSCNVQLFYSDRMGFIGKPTAAADFHDALEECMNYGRTLAHTARHLFNCQFPQYHWRHKFSCFNSSERRLPDEIRIRAFEDICKYEGNQQYHAGRAIFKSFLPTAKRLHGELGCNKQVWLAIQESCRTRQGGPFLEEKQPFLGPTWSYLGLLDESNEVERNFAVLCDQEYKKRERHLGILALSDVLRVAIEIPQTLSDLCTKVTKPNGHVSWVGKDVIKRAQYIYADQFGERALESRKPPEKQTSAGKASFRMTTVERSRPYNAKTSLRERTDSWIASAKRMLDDSRVIRLFYLDAKFTRHLMLGI